MSCSIKEIKASSYDTIKEFAFTEVNSKGDIVKILNDKNVLFNGKKIGIRYGEEFQLKTYAEAYKHAISISIRMTNWATKAFGSRYNKDWIGYVKGNDIAIVPFNFPQNLEADIMTKKLIINDINKLSSDQEKYNAADFEGDEMLGNTTPPPAVPDGYNYGPYTQIKKEITSKLIHDINVMKQISNPNRALKEQINKTEKLLERVKKDVASLQSTNVTIDNIFNYFNRDLDLIKSLVQNPTTENLLLARDYLDSMGFVVDGQISNKFSEVFYQDIQNDVVRKQFEDFAKKLDTLNRELEETEFKQTEKILSMYGDEVDLENLPEGDLNKVDFYALPVDGAVNSGPFLKFLRKAFDYKTAKKWTGEMMRRIINTQPKLEKELLRKGHKLRNGLLGKLFNNIDYGIFLRRDPQGNNRLKGKFSSVWDNTNAELQKSFSDINKLIDKVRNSQDASEKRKAQLKILNTKKKAFDDLKKRGMKFIDVSKIPEFITDPDLSQYFNSQGGTATIDEAEAYKKELLQILTGLTKAELDALPPSTKKNKMKSAEKEYNKMREEQFEKLLSYQLTVENRVAEMLQDNGVSSIDDLPASEKSELEQFIATNSPTAFMKAYEKDGTSNVEKKYIDIDGNEKTTTEPSTLKYISYLPTEREYYSQSFSQDIESNDIFYEAWENFSDAITFINKNRKYKKEGKDLTFDDSMLYSYEMLQEHLSSIMQLFPYAGKSFIDQAANILSTGRYKNPNKQLRLQGEVRAVDEVIKELVDIMGKSLEAQGVDIKKVYDPTTTPASVKKYIEDKLKGPIPRTLTIEKILKEIAQKEVLKGQKTNMSDMLNLMLKTVESFKARKEIEANMLFVNNMLKRYNKKNNLKRPYQEILGDSFLEHNLYGINNRENWLLKGKGEGGFSITSRNRKEVVQAAKEGLKLFDKLMQGIDEMDLDEAGKTDMAVHLQKQIDIAEATIKSGGRVISTGSVLEAVLISANILVGLGLNGTAQISNWAIGDLAGMESDGLEWQSGNYEKAKRFVSKWKVLARYQGKKTNTFKEARATHDLTNTFTNDIAVFQNSANEIDNVYQIETGRKLSKYVKNPTHLVGEIEKTIQRPQIYSILGDITKVWIEDNNGVRHKVMDLDYKEKSGKDSDNIMPGFRLVNGRLELKPEFQNEHNQSTWIDKTSDQYAEWFSDSGLIPMTIARINGDYRPTSSLEIKKYTLGAVSMVFKTWYPAYLRRHYGSKEGVITNLAKNGLGQEAFIISSMQAGIYAFAASASFVNPFIGVGIVGSVYGVKYLREKIKYENNKTIALLKEIISLSNYIAFAGKTLKYGGIAGVKTTQVFLGKRVIPDSAINKMIGLDKENYIDEEGDVDLETYNKDLGRLNLLLTKVGSSIKTTALMAGLAMAYGALHKAMDWDEEDEDEYYLLEKAYIGSMNLLSRYLTDTSLFIDPLGNARALAQGNLTSGYDKVDRLANALDDQLDGKGTYTQGDQLGQNKALIAAGNMLLPKGVFDKGTLLAMGLGTLTREDYTPDTPLKNLFKNEKEELEKKRLYQRALRKQELLESLPKQYPHWTQDRIDDRIEEVLTNGVKERGPDGKTIKGPDGKANIVTQPEFPTFNKHHFDKQGNLLDDPDIKALYKKYE